MRKILKWSILIVFEGPRGIFRKREASSDHRKFYQKLKIIKIIKILKRSIIDGQIEV